MSYILEALKKADAERKMGAVPGLHVQAVPLAALEEEAPLWRRPLIWGALGSTLAIAAGLAWFQPWNKADEGRSHVNLHPAPSGRAPELGEPVRAQALSPVVAASAPASSMASEPVSSAAPADSAGLSGPAEPDAATVRQAQGSPHSRTAAAPAHESMRPAMQTEASSAKAGMASSAQSATQAKTAQSDTRNSQAQVGKASLAAASPVQAMEKPSSSKPGFSKPAGAKSETGGASAQHPSPDMQVATLRDLPEHIQRTVPQVSVGGYIYSPNPSERSMLINNRLVREGETIGSGLVLEKMLPNKEIVLNFQGQRYRMPY